MRARSAEIIRRRFGVDRTPEAVRRHAYRIGAPIFQYEVCPECGRKVDHLSRSGVCYQCGQRALAEGQRRERERIKAEVRRNGSKAERRKAEREYERERAANYRLRRKHGIVSGGGCGDSVECVTQMSHA